MLSFRLHEVSLYLTFAHLSGRFVLQVSARSLHSIGVTMGFLWMPMP